MLIICRNYLTQDIVRRILQDYFGYDVNFVMNVTDIDDKVSIAVSAAEQICIVCYRVGLTCNQIILRARESHLVEELIKSTPALTPELVSLARDAFTAYFHKRIIRNEPSPTEPPSPNADAFDHFDTVAQRDQADATYAKAARDKEEKWSMYLASLSKASASIRIAEKELQAAGGGGAEGVKQLVEGVSDVLGPYLGETASPLRAS